MNILALIINGQRLKTFLELRSLAVETTLLEDPSY
jgi:hypothetical protein